MNTVTMSFEDEVLGADWQTDKGEAVALSACHAKDGRQSLCWSWTGHSRLRHEGLSLDAGAVGGAERGG